MLLAPVPWAGCVWALPFLTVLAPSGRSVIPASSSSDFSEVGIVGERSEAAWLGAQAPPCVAAAGRDGAAVGEDAVAEAAFAQEQPDALDRVPFRRLRRQVDEAGVRRPPQALVAGPWRRASRPDPGPARRASRPDPGPARRASRPDPGPARRASRPGPGPGRRARPRRAWRRSGRGIAAWPRCRPPAAPGRRPGPCRAARPRSAGSRRSAGRPAPAGAAGPARTRPGPGAAPLRPQPGRVPDPELDLTVGM